MTKNEFFSRVAAIVTTLAETNGTPESNLYIFCNMDMGEYQTLRHVLVESGFVTIKNHYVTLTVLGRDTAEKLNKAITK